MRRTTSNCCVAGVVARRSRTRVAAAPFLVSRQPMAIRLPYFTVPDSPSLHCRREFARTAECRKAVGYGPAHVMWGRPRVRGKGKAWRGGRRNQCSHSFPQPPWLAIQHRCRMHNLHQCPMPHRLFQEGIHIVVGPWQRLFLQTYEFMFKHACLPLLWAYPISKERI